MLIMFLGLTMLTLLLAVWLLILGLAMLILRLAVGTRDADHASKSPGLWARRVRSP